MRVSAKVDYALRACSELAACRRGTRQGERLSQAQEIPLKFLENILLDLKHAGLVQSQRGAEGGYWLSLPAEEISLAEVIRAVEGPIANVRGPATGTGRVRRSGGATPGGLDRGSRESAGRARGGHARGPGKPGRLPDEVSAIARRPDAWLPH